ncbi:putative lipoprotein [Pedobacter sp. CG_S7]|uniref:hypothetical protein n=1 Tax=Pedobacter sp. CG_S7 TaxID=3143930 RepID=UPI00339940EA
MKLKLLKNNYLPVLLFLFILTVAGCKKDKLNVDQIKEYEEVGHTAQNEYDGGWRLTLNPDGSVDILPTGDISYRGTYKINGAKIKVKTEQNSGSYAFEIISETEIKEKEFGTLLRLKQ